MRPGFRMTIGAHPGEVAGVSAAFGTFADAHAVPAQIRRSVSIVLDELLANTIAHGFRGRADGGGEVTVDAELLPDRLSITVTDDGRPFDPFELDAPDTMLTTAERPIGGLGVHLVKHMMDDIRYERRGDRNVIVMEKRLKKERS
jgi:anti-sigma regulatory factor (Ser/Thr protein kinase)